MSILQELLKELKDKTEHPNYNECVNNFMKELIKQDDVFCVSPWDENLKDIYPFIGLHNDVTSCFYIFTNADMAFEFTKHYEMTSPDDVCIAFKVKTNRLLPMLQEYKKNGIESLMIDERGASLYNNIEYFINILSNINKNT